MNCKNCGKELAEDEIICTQCAEDNSPEIEEEPKSGINPWKIAFPVTASLCLLLVLSWLLYFGVTGNLIPDLRYRENNIYYKQSYTATESELNASRNRVVATLGKNKLTNAQLQVFYSRVKKDYSGEYTSGTPLDEQVYDEETGLTWQQYLLELALNTWKQYRLLTDQAKEAGFELPEEYQEYLDGLEDSLAASAEKYNYDSVNDLLADDICTGCTLEDYKYYLELYYWGTLYYYELTDQIEVTTEEIEAYFAENEEIMAENGFTKDSGLLVDMRNILIKPESNEEEVSIMEWEACHSQAEYLLDLWLQGEGTEESFAELAAEYSVDTESSSNGGLYNYVAEYYFGSVDVRHILIMPEGGTKDESGNTVYSDEEWEACRKKAQQIYDEYLAGELTEEHFSDLAAEHSEDGNASSGGIYTDVVKNYMVEEFDAWIFDESREPGDTDLVKTQFGYHIMYFVHRDCDLNDWLFAEDRQPGNYEIIKTDAGYQIVYYVSGEEGWILYCRLGVAGEKAEKLLTEMTENAEMKVTYRNVSLESKSGK